MFTDVPSVFQMTQNTTVTVADSVMIQVNMHHLRVSLSFCRLCVYHSDSTFSYPPVSGAYYAFNLTIGSVDVIFDDVKNNVSTV